MANDPFITAVIPVRNGEQTLEDCLASIKAQIIAEDIEILILDSDSTDSSVSIARKFDARIINIPAATFNHGLTRNLGAKEAKGELVFFTVQDARLSEKEQLKKMAAYFQQEDVQAVMGMQATPHEKDKNPAMWFTRYNEPTPVFRFFPTGTFAKMESKEQFKHAAWDDVNAMYRKTALMEIPFRKADFGEDWLWAKDALSAGKTLVYDPSLIVCHYHHRTFKYSFREKYIVSYNFYKNFGVLPTINLNPKSFLTPFYLIWKKKDVSLQDKVYWTGHSFADIAAIFLSHLIFNSIAKLGGEKSVDKSYNYFCSKIPQGKVRS